jgi:hypothetical protein
MMKLHTITGVKPYDDAGRLLLRFDDDDRAELTTLVDLSSMLAQGGVFEPLRDPSRFMAVEIGPRLHASVACWRGCHRPVCRCPLDDGATFAVARGCPTAPSQVKSEPGPPMTLGAAAAAQVRLIVWCKACQHQVEPDPAEMAARYGADTSVLDWRERLVCSSLTWPIGSGAPEFSRHK